MLRHRHGIEAAEILAVPGLPPRDDDVRGELAETIAALLNDPLAACGAMNVCILSVLFAPRAQLASAEKFELIADARIKSVIGCS